MTDISDVSGMQARYRWPESGRAYLRRSSSAGSGRPHIYRAGRSCPLSRRRRHGTSL